MTVLKHAICQVTVMKGEPKSLLQSPLPSKRQPCLSIPGLHGQQAIGNFPKLLHSGNK